jgi:curved DNA-binding protein CbpA
MLGLPRRPWLESAAVRSAFQEKARSLHPDAGGGDADAFARLNAAYRSVGSPASRLRLLIGEAAIPSVPPDMEFGFRVGTVTRSADALLVKLRAAANPLARALLVPDLATCRRDVDELLAGLEARMAAAESRLRECDAAWPEVDAAKLAGLAGECSFHDRWREQLHARLTELRIIDGGAPPAAGARPFAD